MTEKYVRVCTNCGGTDISVDYSNPVAICDVGTQSNNKCNDCQVVSYLFPEVLETELETFRLELKKKPDEEKPKELYNTNLGYTYGLFDIALVCFFILLSIIFLIFTQSYVLGFLTMIVVISLILYIRSKRKIIY